MVAVAEHQSLCYVNSVSACRTTVSVQQRPDMTKKRWKKKGQAEPGIQADADPTTRSIARFGDLVAVAAGKRWRVLDIRYCCFGLHSNRLCQACCIANHACAAVQSLYVCYKTSYGPAGLLGLCSSALMLSTAC
jgi:hypothetical protein